MKIKPLSDIHLEHDPIYHYEYNGEDVVVLAGDISPDKQDVFELVNEILDASNDVHVIIVLGNHDFYGSTYRACVRHYSFMYEDHDRVHFLENNMVEIGNVLFYGGSMFTSLEYNISEHDIILRNNHIKVATSIYDFFAIDKWDTTAHKMVHDDFKTGLASFLGLDADKKCVVSHFIPTPQHVHERFDNMCPYVNAYFVDDMERFSVGVDLWIHGHGHDPFDTMIGNCRFVANPRGYPREQVNHNTSLIIEI